MRQLTVVAFVPGIATAGPVDPAELQKRYDFRKDTLSKPETRTLVQIPVKDAASAQKVSARLAAGEPPAAIAPSLGVDVVAYDDKPLTAIADRKVGQAAFKLASGQVATLQGDLGLAVVRVVAVNPGRVVTLNEARPMLEAEIRKDQSAEKVYAQTQAYEDAHQGGASVADSAKKAGVPLQTIGPITAQAVDAQRRQLQGLPPKILETAFALPAGGESDITELGNGAYFVVRVERIVAAHVQPLEEIRPLVTTAWMRREIGRAMEARAATLTERLKKGEPLETVASGYAMVRVAGLSRQTAESRQAEVGREGVSRPPDVVRQAIREDLHRINARPTTTQDLRDAVPAVHDGAVQRYQQYRCCVVVYVSIGVLIPSHQRGWTIITPADSAAPPHALPRARSAPGR